ncbi:sulfatase-like hydrolase/transferase [Candidatus Hydrogenedentota bacterium]
MSKEISNLSRRDFLKMAGLAATSTMLAPKLAHAQLKGRPNIIWIIGEEVSPALGCYGDSEAFTPNLDRFARQGALFTNTYAVSGVRGPNRSALMTGMYPTSIGSQHYPCDIVPPSEVKCFTEYLRAAGYYCTNNHTTSYGFDCPDTAWDDHSRTAHWANGKRSQPFFSVFSVEMCREQRIRQTPRRFHRLIRNIKFDKWSDYTMGEFPPYIPCDLSRASVSELADYDVMKARHDSGNPNLPPYYPNNSHTRKDWIRYGELVSAMDYQVGRLLQQLDENGLTDDTVVFFLGDHGRGLPRAKRTLYDAGIHVPMIVRWPDELAPGALQSELVSLVDLVPTTLAIAGISVPNHMEGQVVLGKSASQRQYVFGSRDRIGMTSDTIRCARDKRFKYIRNLEPHKPYAPKPDLEYDKPEPQRIPVEEVMPTMQVMRDMNKCGELRGAQKLLLQETKTAEELYDTLSDPHEINNLASNPDFKSALNEMREALDAWMSSTNDQGTASEPEMNEQMRPGGRVAVAPSPLILANDGTKTNPVLVTLNCPAEGASIAYTTDEGENPRWRVYGKPIALRKSAMIRAKTCRLGYKDSSEVVAHLKVEPAYNGHNGPSSWDFRLVEQDG